jgi:hypothetical protein
MDSARWHRIQGLFHDAADAPQAEQRAFLGAACGDDEELIVEVLAMLDQDASGHSLLDCSLADVAQETLAKAVPASLILKEFGPYRILKTLVLKWRSRSCVTPGFPRHAANALPANNGPWRN